MKNKREEKIKPRQQGILILIYKFRFLNRRQIQTLLNHKQWTKVILWLNDLTERKYLKRYYHQKIGGEPAAYSLGTKGRKYLKTHKSEIRDINTSLLDRVWKEYKYTKTFKKHCMFVADIYISLLELMKKVDGGKGKLHFFTKTDITSVEHIMLPEPDAYFAIEDKNGLIKRYFLDIFDFFTDEKELQERIEQYFTYFDANLWQENMKHDFPEIIFVCSRRSAKYYLQKNIKCWLSKKESEIHFYLSTWQEITKQGINKQVLHKVEKEY